MNAEGEEHARPPISLWAWGGLGIILVFTVWWRGHTVGPSVRERVGWRLWPETRGQAEPLDCDEAAYGYIGKRLSEGAVMYRDVSENKPPGGYWLYGLAVKLGGASELTIRLMPVPMVLGTVILVWWIGVRISGPMGGVVSAFTFSMLSTDPYLYGNGANLEHAMNLFSVGSLAAMIASWRGRRGWVVVAGALVGAATLVKQVEALVGPVYAVAVWYRTDPVATRSRFREWVLDAVALLAGFLAVWFVAVAVVMGQGAWAEAWHDVVKLGSAIASAPSGPHERTFLIRWITGNADPRNGALPWPFGRTDWLVWWGSGSWPVWVSAVPGLVWLLRGRPEGPRKLVVVWTFVAWVEVALPGMFWAHYYLLPTPGLSVAVGVGLGESITSARRFFQESRVLAAVGRCLIGAGFASALVLFLAIQVRDYLLVPPEELTVRYKGGGQWIRDREIGLELARRAPLWKEPKLYVWGWQSPLYFYSGMDCPTRYFFANDWVKNHVGRNEPLVEEILGRTMSDLKADSPGVIFVGNPPFPELRAFLNDRYVPSPVVREGPFLWVDREHADAFDRVETSAGPDR